MPPGVSLWHSLLVRHARSVKELLSRASKALDAQLSSGPPQARLETILVRNTPKQPLHPIARIRQNQSHWFSTARRTVENTARHFSSSTTRSGASRHYDRASFPKSRAASYVNQSAGRTPFASTLRPNLTGGALGRTAGGYTLGSGRVGGARYFSHGPACQAQVVQNVSQAVRAFFISGQKAQFNGTSPRTGEKRYKAVSALQDETGRKLRSLPAATPGSTLQFTINPTITALTPLAAIAGYSAMASEQADHLNTDGLLDALSVDFSRALKDLAAVLNDLKRLSALGNLPITSQGSTLQVHFPGCDVETVERLCRELNVQRGKIVQDATFDSFTGTEIALLFPFAPESETSEASEEDAASLFDELAPLYSTARPVGTQNKTPILFDDMLTSSSPAYSTQSDSGLAGNDDLDLDVEDILAAKPWAATSNSPSSVPFSGYEDIPMHTGSGRASTSVSMGEQEQPLEYQGFEGIYRFLEELDGVKDVRRM